MGKEILKEITISLTVELILFIFLKIMDTKNIIACVFLLSVAVVALMIKCYSLQKSFNDKISELQKQLSLKAEDPSKTISNMSEGDRNNLMA